MRIGKAHPFGSQLIQVFRGDLSPLRIVAQDVAIAEIIRENHDDIRTLRRGNGPLDWARSKRQEHQERERGLLEAESTLGHDGFDPGRRHGPSAR